MSEIDTKHLRALCEAATPGPWRECASEVLIGDHWWRPVSHAHYRNDDDAAFIAACSPTTVLALLDELERVTGERDAYRKAKSENDDRFMIERDEARSDRDALRAALEEACDLAHAWARVGTGFGSTRADAFDDMDRIATLRKAGSQP